MERRFTYSTLVIFAVAMALLEATVVIYMRRLHYPENPLELFPLRFLLSYEPYLEFAREVSTIVMLLAVAFLAERTSLTRTFAAFVFTFGLWDLMYYAWLKILIGWPQDWFEWDVLFLIPTIWLGPWICPAMIAVLFSIWGTAVLLSREERFLGKRGVLTFTCGSVAGLVTFIQPAIPAWWARGITGVVEFVPHGFWWWLFVPAYVTMTIGLWSCFWRSARMRPS
jgi:hypothetical protein